MYKKTKSKIKDKKHWDYIYGMNHRKQMIDILSDLTVNKKTQYSKEKKENGQVRNRLLKKISQWSK